MPKSCYIHIPFCKTICSYCDFCKHLYDKKKVKEYLKVLKQEVDTFYQKEPLETIYIGGGTPTCLENEELLELMEITDSLKKEKDIEFTIEGNIETITQEKLKILKEHGINRISIGIESTIEENQEFLNRKINKEEVREKIRWMRNLGFQNINLDLMYAIPKETIEMVREDLEFITSLDVEHISAYSLMIEDHTLLKMKKIEPIEEELDRQMYEEIRSYLSSFGYHQYEISNYAKAGKESKHNKCYWLNEEYYGFGLGAASYIGNVRKINTKSLTTYPSFLKIEEEILDQSDQIEYEILLNLRLTEGIDLNRFQEKYQKNLEDLYEIDSLIQENLLVKEKNHLKIPKDKLYVSNQIIVKLLDKEKGI